MRYILCFIMSIPLFPIEYDFDFNSDIDTVGIRKHFDSYVIDHIKWGKTKFDSTSQRRTFFKYPHSLHSDIKVSFLKFNSDDLSDILIDIKEVNESKNDSTKLDTTFRKLVIFGQDELYKMDTIDITEIKDKQTSPFTALFFNKSRHLKGKQKNHLKNISSHFVKGEDIKIKELKDEKKREKIAPEFATEDLNTLIKVFPNPAKNYVNVELSSNLIESYDIRIFDNMSKLVLDDVVFQGTTSIDTSLLPNGQYHITFTSKENQSTITQSFIIRK